MKVVLTARGEMNGEKFLFGGLSSGEGLLNWSHALLLRQRGCVGKMQGIGDTCATPHYLADGTAHHRRRMSGKEYESGFFLGR